MASWPDYDPRWFVRGLKPTRSYRLTDVPGEHSVAPSLDRAFQQVYIPGSTFKPFTALAAVKEGVADFGSYYPCPAEYVHPGDTSGHDVPQLVDRRISAARSLDRAPEDLVRHVFYEWGSDF